MNTFDRNYDHVFFFQVNAGALDARVDNASLPAGAVINGVYTPTTDLIVFTSSDMNTEMRQLAAAGQLPAGPASTAPKRVRVVRRPPEPNHEPVEEFS